MGKRKGHLAVVDDDMTEDEDLDEEFEDEDEEEDDEDLDDLEDDEDEDEEEEAKAPAPPKKRAGSKRTPAPVAEADDDDDDDEDFEEALGSSNAGVPNTPSARPALGALNDDQLVIELTDLIVQGDDSEMTTILVPVFTGPRGGKIAKQLVREARDRAIARIKRVANVAQVNIDTFSDDD